MGLSESELEELKRQRVPETTVVSVHASQTHLVSPSPSLSPSPSPTTSDPSPAVAYTYHSKYHEKNHDNNTKNIAF